MDLTKYPLLSRTLDWRSMLKDKIVTWEDWYQAPLWRKWQAKQSGISDEYHPMHELQDFKSPKFLMLIEKMTSDDPRIHALRTPLMKEVFELVNIIHHSFKHSPCTRWLRLQNGKRSKSSCPTKMKRR